MLLEALSSTDEDITSVAFVGAIKLLIASRISDTVFAEEITERLRKGIRKNWISAFKLNSFLSNR